MAHLLGLDIFVGGRGTGLVVRRICHGQREVPQGEAQDNPKGTWHKQALYQACVDLIIADASPTDLKTTIWKHLDEDVLPVVCEMAKARGHHVVYSAPGFSELVIPVVCEMAKARGHHVVYSAPGFSELQPIEMVWANVKGTVGRQYTSTTTFQDVRDRLERAFYELDSNVIHSTVAASTAKLLGLNCAPRTAETEDTPEQDSDSDICTDASSSSASSSSDVDY
ncbi:hypothetical protein B5M09_010596 [Aphanomyces astaci]|uniref:Tc1-like transposase DDE domain-containing protein n=1 Tax=Aphanomyces astaci TaxID=112090 RepID=A0A425CSM2_APHAT|nr:hypothetical protein B5M09_010596 [Aphanomyces astaci]